jgi:hypothetical protein
MLEVRDIVLCKVAGNEYLHIVKAIRLAATRSATTASSSTDGSSPSRLGGL